MKLNIKSKSVTSKTSTQKTVQALPPQSVGTRIAALVSHFYKKLRETPLFLANLRKEDYSAQVVKPGKLPRNIQAIVAKGEYGTSVNTVSVKGSDADLGDGRLFELDGIKKKEMMPLSKIQAFGKKNGALHTVLIGKKKTKRTGYILGSMEFMYVGFIDKTDANYATTLETRTLPNGRNEDRTFVLIK